jgi:threonine dehydratase
MEGVVQWLKKQSSKQKVLVLISGGNIDHNFYSQLWQSTEDLNNPPGIE